MGRLFRPRTKNIKASGVLADAKKNIMAVGTRNREMSPPCDVRKHFILILVNIINVFWRYRAAANGSGNGAAAAYDSGSEAAADDAGDGDLSAAASCTRCRNVT